MSQTTGTTENPMKLTRPVLQHPLKHLNEGDKLKTCKIDEDLSVAHGSVLSTSVVNYFRIWQSICSAIKY